MDTAGPWGRLLFALAILVPTLATLGVMLWGDRRIKRAVRATGGRSCTVCLYDLRNLGDTGTCPECGRPFDTAADRAMWGRVNILK